MRYVKPDYFDTFRCTADKCPDTCCAGWQIMIDENALEKYEQDSSAFGGRLHNGIDWQEGCFIQYGRRCSMLNENNLCDLVIEKGEDWLCETCSRYPRHVEEYEGLREWSLSLSCPVAAEIMLNRTAPISFLEDEDETPDPLEVEFEDFDFLLFTQLEEARGIIMDIVGNRQFPIEKRMEIILELAYRMQACVDEGRLYDMDEIILSYRKWTKGTNPEMQELTEDGVLGTGAIRYTRLCQGFTYLEQMERLREEWTGVLKEAKTTLYDDGEEAYLKLYEEFLRDFHISGTGADWDAFRENLLIFFLYTYFCGAVYDDCIYSKAALSVFSVSFIQEFIMCRWFSADKYIDMQSCVEIAYRYAREVEHSDENLILLEECLNGEVD